ncbi:CenpB-DNA-bind-domain-containing protein [Gloeophyllum trabeum ATCC 11539]|uniref:CenpB-DNA-bind-domain-containing protein n=1 Tax=Gloeophyllum trabeum (strain ATCC 11539 / FP-39264 / Madison 617) TaxID=670483 RepID=S7REW1_GLOTA|nr:CenpB-DNA-bind-domain-containing protein [Gloeophyllum trabeum ATCC 11539]EPQ50994.1 CenpB-DNA-bind-domain-containing protein [Gloeophyllum trabeum ATCC 11539]
MRMKVPGLVLLPSSDPSRTDASIGDSHWQMSQQSPTNSSASSSSQSSAMFPLAGRPEDPHYPAYLQTSSYHPSHPQHSPTANYEQERHGPPLDSPQVEGSIGPIRSQTQRGHRGGRQDVRWGGSPGSSGDNSNIRAVQAGDYVDSRPHTPNTFSRVYRHSSSMHQRVPGPEPLQNSWPTTPISSHVPNFYYSQQTHNRSDSTSTSNPRSASPALSIASVNTSHSSAGSAPNSHAFGATFPQPPDGGMMSPIVSRKHRKQRLFNVDRRAICVYATENPHLRQEDIAAQYGVERSTISKILKNKTRWMKIDPDETLKIAKLRPTKFPEIEIELRNWLFDVKEQNVQLTDALIRSKAREVAREMEIPDDKFKASSGWVENFKHRHGIRKGIWHGNGREAAIGRAIGISSGKSEPEPKPKPADANIQSPAKEAANNSLTSSNESALYTIESEDSPEPVSQHPADGHSLSQASGTTGLQAAWQPQPQSFGLPSPPASVQGSMPQAVEHPQPAPETAGHYCPPGPMAPHQGHHVVPEPPTQQDMVPHAPAPYPALFQNPAADLPQPQMSPPVPNVVEARSAMNTVLRWVDAQGVHIPPEHRQALDFLAQVLQPRPGAGHYGDR